MSQIKLFQNYFNKPQQTFCMLNNLRKQNGQQLVILSRTRSTVAATSTTHLDTPDSKPFTGCPKVTISEMICGNLPGGKFYKKSIKDLLSIIQADKGPCFILGGMLGRPDVFVTHNPKDFEIVFRMEGTWPIRKGFDILEYHRKKHRKEFFGDLIGLIADNGKSWADVRTSVNPILMHPKNVKSYLSTMFKVNEEFIQRIKQIRDPATLEMPENFRREINQWTLESVSVVALDQQLGLISGTNPDGKLIFENLSRFFDLIADLEFKPSIWRWIPTRKLKEAMQVLDALVNVMEKYINAAMKRIESQATTTRNESEMSVLEKLVKIDKKIAVVMAMDMLFAGVDTTTTLFTGLLLCLAKNPEKQAKLREEIMKVLPEKNSPLTEENMKNMPYLRACIKESLRIYPLTLGNSRTTQEDLVLSDYKVPKGTVILMGNLPLLENDTYYSQPQQFIPERWLRTKDASAAGSCPATKSSNPFVYLPFGFGPRSCIGRRIAEMEVEIGVARLVRNFQIEFNHSVENAFNAESIFVPIIPLKFKFMDLEN